MKLQKLNHALETKLLATVSLITHHFFSFVIISMIYFHIILFFFIRCYSVNAAHEKLAASWRILVPIVYHNVGRVWLSRHACTLS